MIEESNGTLEAKMPPTTPPPPPLEGIRMAIPPAESDMIPPKPPKKRGRWVIPAALGGVCLVVVGVLVALNFTTLCAYIAPELAVGRGIGQLAGAAKHHWREGGGEAFDGLYKLSNQGDFDLDGSLRLASVKADCNVQMQTKIDQDGLALNIKNFLLDTPIFAVEGAGYLSGKEAAISLPMLTGADGVYGLSLERPLADQAKGTGGDPDLAYVFDWDDMHKAQEVADGLRLALMQMAPQQQGNLTLAAAKVFAQVAKTIPHETGSTVFSVGEEKIKYTSIRYEVTQDDLLALLDGLAVVEGGTLVNSGLVPDDAGRDALAQNMVCKLTLICALGQDGTLAALSISGQVDWKEDTYQIEQSITFGANPGQQLVLDGAVTVRMEDGSVARISLESEGTPQNATYRYTQQENDYELNVTLNTAWDAATGGFKWKLQGGGDTVALEIVADGRVENLDNGVVVQMNDFSLSTYMEIWGKLAENFGTSFTLTAKPGGVFDPPSYENAFTLLGKF